MPAADVLRSITAILQSGEAKERLRVEESLGMMQLASAQRESEARQLLAEQQFAQTSRLQNIQLVQSNLTIAAKQLEMEKPKLANRLMQSTGLGGYYQEAEEGEPAEDAISDMVDSIKKQMGKGYDAQATQMAGAVFNYYSAKDSDSLINLASSLHYATMAIDAEKKGKGVASKAQRKLFESFTRLGATADLRVVSELASKAVISEQRISKEMSEFLQGDYEIQDPVGIYADIDIEKTVSRVPPKPPSSKNVLDLDTSGLREAINLASAKRDVLQKKMDTEVATDEEKEEYYALPGVIDRYRLELFEKSGELGGELDTEILQLAKDIEGMEKLGLWREPEWAKLKRELSRKKVERQRVGNLMRRDREDELEDEQIEKVSETTGIPASQLKARLEEVEKRKREAMERGVPFGGVMF